MSSLSGQPAGQTTPAPLPSTRMPHSHRWSGPRCSRAGFPTASESVDEPVGRNGNADVVETRGAPYETV